MKNKKWKVTMNAPVTLWFVFLCVGAFILNAISGGVANQAFFMTYKSSLLSPFTWIRFFTHCIGHANFSHLFGNMPYILLLGPLLEEKYGKDVMIELILTTAFITGIYNYVVHPNSALLGASGVCFAFMLLSSITGIREREIPLTFILVSVIYLGGQVYDVFNVTSNVANFAHIIGGIIGAYVGFTINNYKIKKLSK